MREGLSLQNIRLTWHNKIRNTPSKNSELRSKFDCKLFIIIRYLSFCCLGNFPSVNVFCVVKIPLFFGNLRTVTSILNCRRSTSNRSMALPAQLSTSDNTNRIDTACSISNKLTILCHTDLETLLAERLGYGIWLDKFNYMRINKWRGTQPITARQALASNKTPSGVVGSSESTE